ncbi:MAG: rod shape-determining protein RodA [Actinobacteria bacterium]|nr:MAG: rod shape-determining protein RodA [Actinomycetota bacterium]
MSITTERSQVSLLRRDRKLRPDWLLLISYMALSALGLMMIYTASAPRLEALGVSPTRELEQQAAFVLIGFMAFAVVSLISMTTIRPWASAIYLGSIVTLVLVLSPLGSSVKGAQRWMQLGPIRFQPSEIAKLAVILALAALLSAAVKPMRWDRVARAVALVALPAVLIFLQPDLGTMLTFGFIAGVMIFVAGATWRQVAALVVVGLIGTVGLFQVGAIKEYQITRLTAFLDPVSDILNTQYNQYQSQIAIGTGGLFGKGLFNGTQTNLRFVPEQSSDFIFTAVGEQLGFVGSLLVLVLFGIMIWRVLVSAANAATRFGQLVATGVAALLAFHVFVNIGMTVRLMPVTGLPLPFMSSGGTVFVMMSVALGLAHSTWLRRPTLPIERSTAS